MTSSRVRRQRPASPCAKRRRTAKANARRANARPSRPKRAGAPGGGCSGPARSCCSLRHWRSASGSTTDCTRKSWRPRKSAATSFPMYGRRRCAPAAAHERFPGRAPPRPSSKPISSRGRAATSRSARSTSAATSRPETYWWRSRRSSSSIRLRRPRGRWRSCKHRCCRPKPIAISPKSRGIATKRSSIKVGPRSSKATPIA